MKFQDDISNMNTYTHTHTRTSQTNMSPFFRGHNKPTKFGHRNSVYLFYMSKNRILTSIKSCNSATNLQKMTLYNPNPDLININVYTIFGLILFIL